MAIDAGERDYAPAEPLESIPPELRGTWDGRVRRFIQKWLPWPRLLPDTEGIYVRSLLYTFGVLNLCAIVMLLLSGITLAFLGPAAWHTTPIGKFFDAVHYWSVQTLFMVMFVHFLAVYFMGAFRGRRWITWMLGLGAFFICATTGLTGYTLAQNFDAQWISTQAKDAVNATGMGGVMNLLNTGQIMGIHYWALPAVALLIIAVHVIFVRVFGIAPPYDAPDAHLSEEAAS